MSIQSQPDLVIDLDGIDLTTARRIMRRSLQGLLVGESVEVRSAPAGSLPRSLIGHSVARVVSEGNDPGSRPAFLLQKLAPLGPLDWLPIGFSPPARAELPTGHHLRLDARQLGSSAAFAYVISNRGSSADEYGSVRIDPPQRVGGVGAEISWQVTDGELGNQLEAALVQFIPEWIGSAWPILRPRFIGLDITRESWQALDVLDLTV